MTEIGINRARCSFYPYAPLAGQRCITVTLTNEREETTAIADSTQRTIDIMNERSINLVRLCNFELTPRSAVAYVESLVATARKVFDSQQFALFFVVVELTQSAIPTELDKLAEHLIYVVTPERLSFTDVENLMDTIEDASPEADLFVRVSYRRNDYNAEQCVRLLHEQGLLGMHHVYLVPTLHYETNLPLTIRLAEELANRYHCSVDAPYVFLGDNSCTKS